jgi:CIC family chloride channel protein
MYGLAAIVGLAAGMAAVLFDYLSRIVAHVALTVGVGYEATEPAGEVPLFLVHGEQLDLTLWVGVALILVPALGGFCSGWLARFAPEAAGHGTDAVIDAYHNKDGLVRTRVPFIKALATALSLGTGGSGGREGPIAQIGAGFGSFLGRVLNLTVRHRRILLAAGMGAGVGSIFRAPLAGALFAAEILYRESEFESDVVMPSFIASAVAYCGFCGWHGDFGTLFRLSEGFTFTRVEELLPYTVLALVLVPAVFMNIKVFYGVERLFARLPGPRTAKAAIGGGLTGAVALALWSYNGDENVLSVLSYGYGVLQETFDGKITGSAGAQLLLMVALGKIVTTALTISSGGSGGVFGPSMVIGGGVGGAVGIIGQQAGWVTNPACFMVVGMCGFFAGAAKTPISTIIMVSEMTGSYELLLPAMWVCALTFILSSRWTIYEKQVDNRTQSSAHRGEFLTPLLEKMFVSDVFEREEAASLMTTVAENAPLSEIVKIVARSHDDYFPVLDQEGRFVGIFSAHDVREYTYDDALHGIAIAADLMVDTPITLSPDDDLHTALTTFNIKHLDELPVVADDDPQHLLGMMPRRAISRAYNEKLKALEVLRHKNR